MPMDNMMIAIGNMFGINSIDLKTFEKSFFVVFKYSLNDAAIATQ